jgi:hypothetical protein
LTTRDESEDEDLKLSRLLTLVEIALTRRPFTLLALAPLTLYLPNYLIERFWPAPPETVWSFAFAWWYILVLPPYSITALFYAWIALQLFPGAQGPRPQLADVFLRLLPLVNTSVLVGVGIILGAILLLIPGIVFGLACTVAIPIVAIERRNPIAAIRRSLQLTHHRLWAIFGYGFVVMLPLAAVAFVLELSFVDWDIRQIDQDPFVNNILKPFIDTIIAAINAALTAAFYFELVRLQAKSVGAVTASGGDETGK